ncbi:MAG TPA: hypothetical protein VNV17_07450, partial [Solirubrobacteraceae bacterium]|nr:hypothetical protein [Solirubrobacteraceae bacterium]
MHTWEPSEARAQEPAVRAIAGLLAAPDVTGAAGPDAARILALQRTAGNTAVRRMLARGQLARRPRQLSRDTPAGAAGEAAAAAAAATADWTAVVPDAQDTVITT